MGIIEAILHEVETKSLQKGKEEEKEEVIEKILIYGLTAQQIAEALELPIERVQQIATSLREQGKLE